MNGLETNLLKLERSLPMMEKYGGSFVKGLANLYRRADPTNKTKLLATFRDYFCIYRWPIRQAKKKN